jgi:NDP-sugar pyrophosphorylase family protein
LQAIEKLDPEKETIVNYADFTCDWNYRDFCNMVKETKCDGAIPCYRGFHPHTLWSNYYAYVPEKEMHALDIQEKKPFTDFPREEFASSGTYYFKSANLMRQYFERCVTENLTVGDEYYVSMAYKPMIQDGLNIQVYELKHFMQWGTPADLESRSKYHQAVSVRLSENYDLAADLTGIAEVGDVEKDSEDDMVFRILTSGSNSIFSQVSEIAQAKHWPVTEFHVSRGQLEDVFRTVTQQTQGAQ